MALTLSEQVDRFIDDTDIAHMIIHGDIHTTVRTEGGLVRSFAKVINDANAYMITNADSLLAQVTAMVPTVEEMNNMLQEMQDIANSVVVTGGLVISPVRPGSDLEQGVEWYDTENFKRFSYVSLSGTQGVFVEL